MTNARRVVTPALLGGWGALLAWSAVRWGPGLDQIRLTDRLTRDGDGLALQGMLIGGLVGVGQVLASIRNTPRLRAGHRTPQAAWGLTAAVASGLLALLVARLDEPRWFVWACVGASAGSIDGILGGSRRSVLAGLLGGSLLGALGGFLVYQADGAAEPHRWALRSTLSASAWVAAGAMIGAGGALARLATCPAWVDVTRGPQAGLTVPMERPILTIGSDPRNDIQLTDNSGRSAGAYHARILRKASLYQVVTTCPGSTYVENERVQGSRTLSHGELIMIAGQKLRFRLHPLSRSSTTATNPTPITYVFAEAAANGGASPPGTPLEASTVVRPRKSSRFRQEPAIPAPPVARESIDVLPGQAYIPAPTGSELEKETIAPCPNCGRRYFGGPGRRYCDRCQCRF